MSWNKIDNLLKRAEAFYKKALWEELVSTAQKKTKKDEAEEWLKKYDPNFGKEEAEIVKTPEPVQVEPSTPVTDLGLYNRIISFAQTPSAEEVRNELKDIAELYKDAIDGKIKFSKVATQIGKFINNTLEAYYGDFNSEEDIEEGQEGTPEQQFKREKENIEDFMMEVYNDVNARYKHQIDIEKGLVAPTSPAPVGSYDEEEDIPQSEREGPAGYKGEFDKSEFGGKDQGKKQGASAQNARTYKDYIDSANNEIKTHLEDLKSIQDPSLRKRILEKVAVLQQLLPLLEAEKQMQEDPTIGRTAVNGRMIPNDPDKRAEFFAIKDQQNKLKQKNNYLKAQIKTFNVLKENEDLIQQLNNSRSPKERAYLTQRIELNKLIASSEKNKIQEIDARKKLIKAMLPKMPEADKRTGYVEDRPEVYLANISPADMAKYLADIDAASKNKISLSDWYKQEAAKIKTHFSYIGNRRVAPIDVEGIFTQYKQSIPSIKMGYKKKITAELRESKDTKYLPFRDAIAQALKSGNAEAVKVAEKAFQKQLNNDAEEHQVIKSFIAYSEDFMKYLNELRRLHKNELETAQGGMVLLSATNKEVLEKMLIEAKRLFALEMQRNPGRGARGTSNVAKALELIIDQLNERISAYEGARITPQELVDKFEQRVRVAPEAAPEEEEAVIEQPALKKQVIRGFNQMSLKEKMAELQKILDQENLEKNAQGQTMTDEEAYAEADRIMDAIIEQTVDEVVERKIK